jgi:cellobiose phosphorylase
MNDRGNSFSRYRTLQLNRYRKITEQDYGMFFYIKDLDTKKVWSNTYAPINEKADQYEVVFASDKIKYLRRDGAITTKTEIIVTTDHNAEIRKLTFINDSDSDKKLELTSYTEPILSENPADISHKTFNSMFLESSFDSNTETLFTKRVSRTGGATSYMLNRFIIENPLEDYSYETERINFIGRNNTVRALAYLEYFQRVLSLHTVAHSCLAVGRNISEVYKNDVFLFLKLLGVVSIYFQCLYFDRYTPGRFLYW